MEQERRLISGLDFGKLADYTAFAVFECTRPKPPNHGVEIVEDAPGMGRQTVTRFNPADVVVQAYAKLTPRDKLWRYRLVRLERWSSADTKREDLYNFVCERLAAVYRRPWDEPDPKKRGLGGTTLAVDGTGVGVAIVEMLRKEFRLCGSRCNLRPITITAGKEVNVSKDETGWKVPKGELVSVMQVLMGTGRLTIEPRLPLAKQIKYEYDNFKEKISTTTANASYEAEKENIHDDLVMASSVALWVGERGQREMWVA